MIVALRYVEKEGGYWDVRTEETIEQYQSLRQFQEQKEIAALAARAIQESGIWVAFASSGQEHKRGE